MRRPGHTVWSYMTLFSTSRTSLYVLTGISSSSMPEFLFERRKRYHQLMGWDAGPWVYHLKLKKLDLACILYFPSFAHLGLICTVCEKFRTRRSIVEFCVFVLESCWGWRFQNGSQSAMFWWELGSPQIWTFVIPSTKANWHTLRRTRDSSWLFVQLSKPQQKLMLRLP